MPSYSFERAIPGQSLTVEPRNAPYERPTEIADPEEAIYVHLDNLSNPDAIEDMMFFLELGVDIKTLTEGILRSAVMEGIHSVDVSLIIAPTIHEYIKSTADALDISYDEGFDDVDRDELTYNRRTLLATKELQKFKDELDGGLLDDVDVEGIESRVEEARGMQGADMMPEEEVEESAQMEMDLEMPEEGSAMGLGLMSRGM